MKQAVGTTMLPAKIGNPADDFETRLATGVVFDKGDKTFKFTDDSLQEDLMRSLGLKTDEKIDGEKEEDVLDHISEDMIVGSARGRQSFRTANPETADSAPLTEGPTVEDPATGATEEVIAVGEPGSATEEVESDREDRPVMNQTYRSVAFAEPDIKFAVSSTFSSSKSLSRQVNP